MIENLSYRPVEKRDFETICKLLQNAEELFFMSPKSEYPFTVRQLETAVENRFNSTVILYEEEIVGFANFYEVVENAHCAIGNVVVKSSFRNRGVGRFLIEIMEKIGVEQYNVSEVHLSCFNANTNGLLLYSKLGYKPYEIEKWVKQGNETCALIKMRKRCNEENMNKIQRVEERDLGSILNLQKKAFTEVAKLMKNYYLPPLLQSIEELQHEYQNSIILKYISENKKIIGSVRGFLDDGNICHIGKLIVDPDFQNQGIGKALMKEIEKCFLSCKKYFLFTGDETPNTVYLYKKIGYQVVEKQNMGGVNMFLMEKENKVNKID